MSDENKCIFWGILDRRVIDLIENDHGKIQSAIYQASLMRQKVHLIGKLSHHGKEQQTATQGEGE